MGNSQCSCEGAPLITTCPIIPAIQCTDLFEQPCNGDTAVCTAFEQSSQANTDSNRFSQGGGISIVCNQTQGACCRPNLPSNKANYPWMIRKPSNCVAECASIEVTRCIILNGNVPDTCAGEIGGNISTTQSDTVNVVCKWPIESFRTLDAVNAWENAYGITTNPNNFTTWNLSPTCSASDIAILLKLL